MTEVSLLQQRKEKETLRDHLGVAEQATSGAPRRTARWARTWAWAVGKLCRSVDVVVVDLGAADVVSAGAETREVSRREEAAAAVLNTWPASAVVAVVVVVDNYIGVVNTTVVVVVGIAAAREKAAMEDMRRAGGLASEELQGWPEEAAIAEEWSEVLIGAPLAVFEVSQRLYFVLRTHQVETARPMRPMRMW